MKTLHCTVEDLLAIRDGEGSGAARQHLEGCDRCRAELERLHRAVPDMVESRDAPGLRSYRPHRRGQAHRRMPGKPADELDARISRRPGDAHPDWRISSHQNH